MKSCATFDPRSPAGRRTDFWRYLSWYLGDKHATRICRFIDFYCLVMKLDASRIAHRPSSWFGYS